MSQELVSLHEEQLNTNVCSWYLLEMESNKDNELVSDM
jgi:hypothetical protein